MHFYCLFVSRTASHFLIIEQTNKGLKKKKRYEKIIKQSDFKVKYRFCIDKRKKAGS